MTDQRFDDTNSPPARRGVRPFVGPAVAPRATRVPLLRPPVVPMRPTRPPFAAIAPTRVPTDPAVVSTATVGIPTDAIDGPDLLGAPSVAPGEIAPTTSALPTADLESPALPARLEFLTPDRPAEQAEGEALWSTSVEWADADIASGVPATETTSYEAGAGPVAYEPSAYEPPSEDRWWLVTEAFGESADWASPMVRIDSAPSAAPGPSERPPAAAEAIEPSAPELVPASPQLPACTGEALEEPAWLRDDAPLDEAGAVPSASVAEVPAWPAVADDACAFERHSGELVPAKDSCAAPASTPASTAADALDRLAQRIRSGEIDVSSVAPGVSDVAVLASILAALLGGSTRH